MEAKRSKTVPQNITSIRLGRWAIAIALVLMIPFLANFPWTAMDYIFSGSVLFSAALGYELATRNMKESKNRIIIGAGVAAMVLFIWALAVAD